MFFSTEHIFNVPGPVQDTDQFQTVFGERIEQAVILKAFDVPYLDTDKLLITKLFQLSNKRKIRKLFQAVLDCYKKRNANIKILLGNVNKALFYIALGGRAFEDVELHRFVPPLLRRFKPRSFIASKSFFVKGVGLPPRRPPRSRSSTRRSRRSRR